MTRSTSPSRRDSRHRGGPLKGRSGSSEDFGGPLHALSQSKMLEFTRFERCKAKVDEQWATSAMVMAYCRLAPQHARSPTTPAGAFRRRAHWEALLHHHSPTLSRQSAHSALGDPYFSDITPPPPGGSASQIPSLVTLGSCLPSSVCCGCYRMVPHSLSSILRSLCLLFQFA